MRAQFLIQNPQIKHGAIKILFPPDEEIGRGVDKADLKNSAPILPTPSTANVGATFEEKPSPPMCGTTLIEAVSTHPGFAKANGGHAIKIARRAIIGSLGPKTPVRPKPTEGKQGFLHPIGISGALEKAHSVSSCGISPTRD